MRSTNRIHRVALLVFALLIFCAATGWSQGYQRKVEVSWDFTTATTTLGWAPNADLSDFGLSQGTLIYHPTSEVPELISTSTTRSPVAGSRG